jgi:hypothetical protein
LWPVIGLLPPTCASSLIGCKLWLQDALDIYPPDPDDPRPRPICARMVGGRRGPGTQRFLALARCIRPDSRAGVNIMPAIPEADVPERKATAGVYMWCPLMCEGGRARFAGEWRGGNCTICRQPGHRRTNCEYANMSICTPGDVKGPLRCTLLYVGPDNPDAAPRGAARGAARNANRGGLCKLRLAHNHGHALGCKPSTHHGHQCQHLCLQLLDQTTCLSNHYRAMAAVSPSATTLALRMRCALIAGPRCGGKKAPASRMGRVCSACAAAKAR